MALVIIYGRKIFDKDIMMICMLNMIIIIIIMNLMITKNNGSISKLIKMKNIKSIFIINSLNIFIMKQLNKKSLTKKKHYKYLISISILIT